LTNPRRRLVRHPVFLAVAELYAVCFSANGEVVISGAKDKRIKFWDGGFQQ
jgi:hypothetical protein